MATVSIKVVDYRHRKLKHGPESWTKREVLLQGGATEGEARVNIEPSTRECRVVAGLTTLPGTVRNTDSKGNTLEHEAAFAFGSGISDALGTAQGTSFGGQDIHGVFSYPLDLKETPQIHFTWKLSPWEEDPEGEATFDLVDQDWLPEVDRTCGLKIQWKGKAERVKVILSAISREPGTCLNSVSREEDEDLVIENQGRWHVLKEGSRDSLRAYP